MCSVLTSNTCPSSGCSWERLSGSGGGNILLINPSDRRELGLSKSSARCVMSRFGKPYFSRPRGTSVICNARLLYRRWQFVCFSYPRCHQGHRLSTDKDVYATPQHWGKIAPLYQVSVTCAFFVFFPPLQFSLFHYFDAIIVFAVPIHFLPTSLSFLCSSLSVLHVVDTLSLSRSVLSCRVSLSLQCSYGRPSYATPGENRGMEEDG